MRTRPSLALLLFIPLLIFLLNVRFVRFVDDDLGEMALARRFTAAENVAYYYAIWTGRYTWAAATWLFKQPSLAWPGLPSLITILGMAALGWAVAQEKGLAGVLVVLSVAPMPEQTIYWQAGTLTYGLPVLLLGVIAYGVFHRGLLAGGHE